MTITIDIGEGKQENIIVNDGDIPIDLAAAFAEKHSLNPNLIEVLAIEIQKNIQQVIEERRIAI